MTSSKFVEILDTSDTPRSHDNVNLDDVIAETRRRSSSLSSERSSSDSSPSRDRSPILPAPQPVKTRLRGLSIRRPKT